MGWPKLFIVARLLFMDPTCSAVYLDNKYEQAFQIWNVKNYYHIHVLYLFPIIPLRMYVLHSFSTNFGSLKLAAVFIVLLNCT